MKLVAKLEKSRELWFVIITCFTFFLLRLPSLFEPYWYGDEGIYEVIGFALRHGRLLYAGIWDNKPPLLYITYSLFNGNQMPVKALSLLFGLATLIIFYFLAKKLLGLGKAAWVSTIIFTVFFGTPFLEGNIANAENFMILFIISAALFIVSFSNKNKNLALFIAGILLSIAFLFKIVAIFDMAAFSLFLLTTQYKKHWQTRKQLFSLFPFICGILLPIIITATIFQILGDLIPFYNAVFTQNVSYVGYGNQLIIPQGLLIIKLILLVTACFLIFKHRAIFTSAEIFILLWSSFCLFNAFFSQRPYTHYLLILIASFSLLCGLLFIKKTQRILNFITLIIIIIVVSINFHFYGKTIAYYGNFVSFVHGNKSVQAYQTFFDANTPRDYDIASYLKTHTNDNIFIWGDDAQIYRLASKLPPVRYTVAYHVTASKNTVEETKQALMTAKPKYLVIMPTSQTLPFTINSYQEKLMISDSIIYERFN